jgi:signal transduction histidine kinase
VVQEGLTNALKHAGPGARVAVRLLPDDRYLHVEVVDSGPVGHRRPAALPDSGHGLTGMRERVSLLGGELTARPAGDGGWLLHARLPLREAT